MMRLPLPVSDPKTTFIVNESDQPVHFRFHHFEERKKTARGAKISPRQPMRVHELASEGSRNGELQKLSSTDQPHEKLSRGELVVADDLGNTSGPLYVLAFGKCWRKTTHGDTTPHQTTYKACTLNDVITYMCEERIKGLQFEEDLKMHSEEIRELKKRNDEISEENEKLNEFLERVDERVKCFEMGMARNLRRNPEMGHLGRRESYRDERHLSRSEEKMIAEKRQESLKEENMPYYTHSERESLQPVKDALLYKKNSKSRSIKKDFSKDTNPKAYKLSNSRSSENVLVNRDWPSKHFDYSDLNHVKDFHENENMPYYSHPERETMKPVKDTPLYKENSKSRSIKKDFSKYTSPKAYKLSNSRCSENVQVDREWPSKPLDYSGLNHVKDFHQKEKSEDRNQTELVDYSKNLMKRITNYVRSSRQLAEVLAESLRSECQRLPDRSIQETELLDSVDDVLFNMGKFLHSISSSDSCVENETVVRRRAAKLKRAINQFIGMMDDSCHSKQRLDKAKQRLTGFLDLSEDLQSERHRLDDVLQFLDTNFDTFTRSCNEAQSKQPSLRQKKSELEQMYRILGDFKQKFEPKLTETEKQKAPCKETTEPEIRDVVEGWISHMLQTTLSSINIIDEQHEQKNSCKTGPSNSEANTSEPESADERLLLGLTSVVTRGGDHSERRRSSIEGRPYLL